MGRVTNNTSKGKLLVLGLVLISSLATVPLRATAQRTETSYGYTHITDASGGYAWSESIAIDSNGNTYVVGNFTGTADFNPGAGTDNHTSAGNQDVFLTKLGTDGSYAYTKTWGGTGFDSTVSIATDSSGNTYVVGAFNGTVDFDPGAGTDNHTSAGDQDIFLTKLGTDGSHAYTKTWGGTGNENASSITIDSNGNTYVAGDFNGTVDFDPGAGTDNHTSAGSSDTYMTKYNANGSYAYTKTWGGTGSENASSIAIDSNGNTYVAGEFTGTVDFDPGAGTDNHTSAGSSDAYLTKFGADGSHVYTNTWGGTLIDYVLNTAVDSSGNTYVAGAFSGTVDFDPGAGTDNHTSAGSSDAYLTKFGADGSHVYTNTWGGTGSEYAYSVAIDSHGNPFVVGGFGGTVDFDSGAGTYNRTSAGSIDTFLTKFGADGSHSYTMTWGGSGYDEAYGLAVDSNDNIYKTGYIDSTSVDFNPYDGTDTKTPSGNGDMFLTKLITTHYQNVTGLPASLKLIDPATGKDMADQSAGGTPRSSSTALRLTTTAGIPITDISVDMSTDLNWSSVIASSDSTNFKSVVHGLASAPGVTGTHSLYVPKRAGDNTVFICPNATTLSEVSETCSNVVAHKVGDGKTTVVTISGIDYWLVSGLTGTGGISGNVAGLADTGQNTYLLTTISLAMIIGSGLGLSTIARKRQKTWRHIA